MASPPPSSNQSSSNLSTEQLHHPHTEDEYSDEDAALDDAWDDWDADDDDDGEEEELKDSSQFKCLFCDSLFDSSNSLFEHCESSHSFDFGRIRRSMGLGFYGSIKLINYVRTTVAEKRCWSCGLIFNSGSDLLNHLHEADSGKDLKLLWEDDKYLQPFMQGDSLLYSFDEDEDGEEEEPMVLAHDEELVRNFIDSSSTCSNHMIATQTRSPSHLVEDDAVKEATSTTTSNGHTDVAPLSDQLLLNGLEARVSPISFLKKHEGNRLKVSLSEVAASEIRKVNESYFGSYSSYGIHREMLSDKARMDAYSRAILNNPSLLRGSVVMDVGCGTGILSLFAAQVGASRVFAVEASEKMAAVASQIAKENGLLWDKNSNDSNQATGVIDVVLSMVEELDKSLQIQHHSVDVLVSEWMGYCLLYESMLSSVLLARDKWLKPGGAILPDTATMFAAGFGRGSTSLPFWENVYGFNMSCVGKELVADASQAPIVDIVDSSDIVTTSAVLQTFDLVTMKFNDMDFTSVIELEPKPGLSSGPTWCYGVALWFETGFTRRFCKETPTVLSTSPYASKTHWCQTILTFKAPLAVSSDSHGGVASSMVGTHSYPASKIHLRISIARAEQHRAIDISLETTAVGHGGRKHSLPVQNFNLC